MYINIYYIYIIYYNIYIYIYYIIIYIILYIYIYILLLLLLLYYFNLNKVKLFFNSTLFKKFFTVVHMYAACKLYTGDYSFFNRFQTR